MKDWLACIGSLGEEAKAFVRVVVVRVEGSAPRETGAAMIVSESALADTIGGGTLEFEAVKSARQMLANELGNLDPHAGAAWRRIVRTQALGPALGQCCGGQVSLLFELYGAQEIDYLRHRFSGRDASRAVLVRPLQAGVAPQLVVERKQAQTSGCPLAVIQALCAQLSGRALQRAVLVRMGTMADSWFVEPIARASAPLFLYGAGHVGRALVRVLDEAPFAVTWVDTDLSRFPEPSSGNVSILPAREPAAAVAFAPPDAFHVVMTFSHALDLAICNAVLARGDFLYLGLIGSATKRERFRKRLLALGHGETEIAKVTCPIGIADVPGKSPTEIAISVAADLLRKLSRRAGAAVAPPLTQRA